MYCIITKKWCNLYNIQVIYLLFRFGSFPRDAPKKKTPVRRQKQVDKEPKEATKPKQVAISLKYLHFLPCEMVVRRLFFILSGGQWKQPGDDRIGMGQLFLELGYL